MSLADWVSALRLLLVAVMWPLALSGLGQLVGFGVVLCGLTDFLDGRLARRLGVESRRGARLDAIADGALLVSVAVWLGVLHPSLVADNATLLAVTGGLYAASVASSLAVFGRAVDPRQVSAKIAGALLYAFALFTLLTGVYEPVLLTVAAAGMAIASLESLMKALAERSTIQPNGIASVMRSQAPHALNEVESSTSASPSIAISATPTPTDIRP